MFWADSLVIRALNFKPWGGPNNKPRRGSNLFAIVDSAPERVRRSIAFKTELKWTIHSRRLMISRRPCSVPIPGTVTSCFLGFHTLTIADVGD